MLYLIVFLMVVGLVAIAGLYVSRVSFPTGWFWENCVWWGRKLDATTTISRGARIDVPDIRTADVRLRLAMRTQMLYLLAGVSDRNAMQVHWSVEDDYHADLEKFDKVTANSKGMTRWSRDRRNQRSAYYRSQVDQGSLRRERVHFYLAHRCSDLKGAELKSMAACESYLRSISSGLETKLRQMEMSFPIAQWTMLDDEGHAKHLRKFLNPSKSKALAAGEGFGELDTSRSIRSNCLRSDFLPFSYGQGETAGVGLYYDGMYHALFVVTRLPMQTKPGMMEALLNANERHCTVVQNIYPLAVEPEIQRLRKEIDELSKSLGHAKNAGLGTQVDNLRARIDSLLSSAVVPFKVLTVIRVWADTPEKLTAAALGTKSALDKLNGLGYHEVSDPVRARNLYLETLPGNLGSTYREWDRYCENLNLADIMPVSATFTGHLDEAQAIFDSPGGGIVGLRYFAGEDLTPQSTTITGATGAGKTALMIESLSQVEHMLDYTYIQEEGMAFATYAHVRGLASIPLKESSDYTLNPFDTFGLPMTSGNLATVCKTAMKLVGKSADDDKNKDRENLIGQYGALLYREWAEDYKDKNEDRWMRLTQLSMASEKMRGPRDDIIDGYQKFKTWREQNGDEAQALLDSFSEEALIRYQTTPQSREIISSMVYTQLAPEDYPQWAALCDMMRTGRLSVHRTGSIGEQLTMLSTSLGQGLRYGGRIGGLIDGATNVPLFGKGLHLDTSFLSDGTLKEVAGFLFPEMVRKHIMTLPRAQFKMMMLDELRRLLLIPGAKEFVKEMLAQLRKYRACFVGGFQSASQIDEIDPALAALLMGQCKQHFMLRQNEANEVLKFSKAIGLPEVAQRAVLSHPLLEHQKKGTKASYFTLFSNEGNGNSTCGTVRVEVDAPSLYVASSNGDVFDAKMAALSKYEDPVDGVYAEVDLARLAKAAAKVKAKEQAEAAALAS